MPSTYTTNNGIELIGTGEQSGTWGDTTNTNLTLVDASLDGHTSITLASAGTSGSPNDVPVTNGAASNGRNRALVFADVGDLGGDVYVRLTPNDAKKIMFVRNSLSGSRDLILFQGTYNASNDFVLAAGKDAIVKFDGGGSGAVASAVLVDLALDAATISGDLTVDTDTLYVDSANNRVGIKNSSPSVPLDVTGNVAVSTKIKVGAGADGGANADDIVASKDGTNVGISILSADATGNSRILLGSQSVTNAAKIQHDESDDQLTVQAAGALQLQSGGTNDRVIVDSSGNVGIGNSSPSVPLDVTGTGLFSGRVGIGTDLGSNPSGADPDADNLVIDAGGADAGVTIDTGTAAKGSLFFADGGTGDALKRGQIVYDHNGDYMAFATNAVERMRLDSSGNVGIGTTSPSENLHVVSTNGTALRLEATNTSTAGGIDFYGKDAGDTTYQAGNINSAGGSGSLEFSADPTDAETNTRVTFLTDGTERVRIDDTGLGIGTTSPAQALDVTGSAAISNKAKVGTGADANGNADELVLSKDATNVGMSLLAEDGSGICRILFGSQTSTNAAKIQHTENGGKLTVQAEGDIFFQTGGTNTKMTLDTDGDLDVTGALSKGSGSFKIDHPLKPETHHLVHSFIEGPQADNLYRGRVALVGGAATVNLDTAGRMTEGTFVALNGNVQCVTSNEQGWTAVKGSVSGNTLTIEAQDATCTDTVSWMVIGERKDQHMIDTHWTDAAGRVITEPEKPPVEEDETV